MKGPAACLAFLTKTDRKRTPAYFVSIPRVAADRYAGTLRNKQRIVAGHSSEEVLQRPVHGGIRKCIWYGLIFHWRLDHFHAHVQNLREHARAHNNKVRSAPQPRTLD